MDELEQLVVVVEGLRVAQILRLLSFLEFFPYRALHLGYIKNVWLILLENVVFFVNHFWPVYIVSLQSLKQALV